MKRLFIGFYIILCASFFAQTTFGLEETLSRNLYLAAIKNDFASVSYFLSQGANIHTPLSQESYTFLLDDYVSLLNPDPSFTNEQYASLAKMTYYPIHIAALQNNVPMITLFIKNNSNINAVTSGEVTTGFTPLMLAVMNNNKEAVALLVKHKADVLATNAEGKNATMIAIEQNNTQIASMLLKKSYFFNINEKIPSSDFPLMIAIKNNNSNLVQMLIKFGANVNLSLTEGAFRTPLTLTIKQKNPEILNLLLKQKAMLFSRDKDEPLFIFATKQNNLDILTLLVKNKVDIHATERITKRNALFYAVEQNNTAMVEYLIQIGVNVATRDAKNKTALMSALNNTVITSLLLAAHAPVNAVDSEGESALFYAIRSNLVTVVEILLQKGAKVNTQNNKEETPLILAIPNAEIVGLLIQNGVHINVKDTKGLTPLMYAAFNDDYLPIVKLLIDAGANINATTADTALISLLVQIIEGDNTKNRQEPNFVYTPLLIAKKRGCVKIVSYLESLGAK
ncbi:MAG: ankyrin repeat domain-containing protein [Treponemataceae bacterium]